MTSPTITADPSSRPFRDLDTRTEVHDLVVRFYREIVFDELLAPVFIETAEVDWAVHIPKLVDFWCRVLLGQPGYDGFVLASHRQVHDEVPFRAELFDRWYGLWEQTVDHGWRGPHADLAKSHAAQIAETLARRLVGVEWRAPGVPEPEGSKGVRARFELRGSDEGGDSACWAHLVCADCGGMHTAAEPCP
jgi:hemoglobin